MLLSQKIHGNNFFFSVEGYLQVITTQDMTEQYRKGRVGPDLVPYNTF